MKISYNRPYPTLALFIIVIFGVRMEIDINKWNGLGRGDPS